MEQDDTCGIDLPSLSAHVDGFVVRGRDQYMMETRTELTCAAKRIGQASNVDVYLSCMPPFVENAQSLVRCVHEISQAAIPGSASGTTV